MLNRLVMAGAAVFELALFGLFCRGLVRQEPGIWRLMVAMEAVGLARRIRRELPIRRQDLLGIVLVVLVLALQ